MDKLDAVLGLCGAAMTGIVAEWFRRTGAISRMAGDLKAAALAHKEQKEEEAKNRARQEDRDKSLEAGIIALNTKVNTITTKVALVDQKLETIEAGMVAAALWREQQTNKISDLSIKIAASLGSRGLVPGD